VKNDDPLTYARNELTGNIIKYEGDYRTGGVSGVRGYNYG